PAELALHRAPRRLDNGSLAVQLVALDRVTANAESHRLTEQNLLELHDCAVGGEDRQENAGTVLLHEDRRRKHIEGAGGEQLLDAVADNLGGDVVEIRLQ